MANPIILIAAAGAALLLLSGKKKGGKGGGFSTSDAPPYEPGQYGNFTPGDTPPAPPKKPPSGPSDGTAGTQIWIARQLAMKYLSDLKMCNSDPGKIDGKLGPGTTKAIQALQICMGMIPDGIWSKAIDSKLQGLMNMAYQKAAQMSANTGKEAGKKWPGIHGLLLGLGYPSGKDLNKAPDKSSVMAFQTNYNLVLTKMNLGKLKTMPGMSSLGMLGTTGMVDTKTVTALGMITNLVKKGNISNWQEVVHAAKNV